MLLNDIHECPRCGGAIPREHYAEARRDYYVDQFLYCEFCGLGWESSVYEDGTAFSLGYQHRTEPVNFGRFLERLIQARVA